MYMYVIRKFFHYFIYCKKKKQIKQETILKLKTATYKPRGSNISVRGFRRLRKAYKLGLYLFGLQSSQYVSCIIRETPDFGPYLLVSRLEYGISQIIAQIAISCRLDFPTIKFQNNVLHCLSYCGNVSP